MLCFLKLFLSIKIKEIEFLIHFFFLYKVEEIYLMHFGNIIHLFHILSITYLILFSLLYYFQFQQRYPSN